MEKKRSEFLIIWLIIFLQFDLTISVKAQFDIIGLFTITNCTVGEEYLCQNAEINAYGIVDRILNSRAHRGYRLGYCFIDTKNSKHFVTETVLQSVERREISDDAYFTRSMDFKVPSKTQLLFLTLMSYEMTRLVSYLLYIEDAILMSLTFQRMIPSLLVEKPTFLYSHEGSYSMSKQKNVQEMLDDGEISYLAILYSKEYEQDDEIVLRDCKERPESAFCFFLELDSEKHEKCYKEIMINPHNSTQMNQTLNTIYKDPYLRFMIFYGPWVSLKRVEKHPLLLDWKFSSSNSEFFIIPFERAPTQETMQLTVKYNDLNEFPGGVTIKEFLKHLRDLKEDITNPENPTIMNALKDSGIIDEFIDKYSVVLQKILPNITKGSEVTYQDWMRIPSYFRELISDEVVKNTEAMKQMIISYKEASYPDEKSWENVKEDLYNNPTRVRKQTEPLCQNTKPVCGAGRYLHHGVYSQSPWIQNYGWHCRLCGESMFKAKTGDTDCKPCHYPLITNALKTTCFDPYTSFFLSLNEPLSYSLFITSVISLAFIISTMLIFMRNRDTPIVKNANRPMTALQLTSHLVLSTLSIYLIIIPPNAGQCFLTPIIAGLSLTTAVSINLAKTQKVDTIFQKKTHRHSAGQRRFLGLLDWLVVSVLLSVDAFILIISYSDLNPEIQYQYKDSDYTKVVTCNNDTHIIIQLFYVLLIILTNAIQAIRSRGLPSYFKETTHVIYSSFISSVLLLTATGIYFAQKDLVTKDMILVLSIQTLNILNFVLVYSYKLYIIMLKPRKNTTAAFSKKRKEAFEMKFSRTSTDVSNTTLSSNNAKEASQKKDMMANKFEKKARKKVQSNSNEMLSKET